MRALRPPSTRRLTHVQRSHIDGRLAWRITDSDGLFRPIRCYDDDVFGALRRVRLGSTTVNDPANPCSDAALNVERSIDYFIHGAGRRVGPHVTPVSS